MAISKKTKKIATWAVVILFGVFVMPRLVSEIRLRGTWNGIAWDDLKKDYPLRLSMFGFGNKVSVPGRPDLQGTLVGNVITWNNGTAFKRG